MNNLDGWMDGWIYVPTYIEVQLKKCKRQNMIFIRIQYLPGGGSNFLLGLHSGKFKV